jgi:mannose-6-phosphate isomerase-like protein (cupin superfamily)
MENKRDISLDELRTLLMNEDGTAPLAADLAETESALIHLAEKMAKQPPLSIKDKILGKIQKLNHQAQTRTYFTLDNLPILTDEANWLDWEAAVAGIAPPDAYENIHLHTLVSDDTRELFVAWVQEFIPEEVHHDLLESFILLEGTCECHIWRDDESTKRIVRMQAGDHIEMKIGENHDVIITSPQPAKAILQWLKLAA